MNIEHDSERISLHDFNELEGNSLRGFLNTSLDPRQLGLGLDSGRITGKPEGTELLLVGRQTGTTPSNGHKRVGTNPLSSRRDPAGS